jgi:DNA-binding transcriptional LysR family regulator
VSYSPALRWFIALLLPLTLAWKLTIGLDDSNELKNRIVELLVQHQFDVVVTEEVVEDMPTIRATSEACRMLISKASPSGWRRHMISELAAATDRTFIVFRGMVYTEQPTWLTLVIHSWSRVLRKLGFVRNTTPVIAVVATVPCDAERLPWDELGIPKTAAK